MVRRGWLLSLSSVTISHVPAASWPGNDIAPQEAGSEGRHRKQQKRKQKPRVSVDQSQCRVLDQMGTPGGQTGDMVLVQCVIKYIFEATSPILHVTAKRNYSILSFWDQFRQICLTNVQ